MTVGERLMAARKANDLNQQQLADELHVSRQTISSWEQGRTYPDIDSLIVLADRFGVTLDELLRDDAGLLAVMKARETGLKEARRGNYASLAVSVLLTLILLLNVLVVPGFKMQPLAVFLVQMLVIAQVTVAAVMRKRYDDLSGHKPNQFLRMWWVALGAVVCIGVVWWRFGPSDELVGFSVGMAFVVVVGLMSSYAKRNQ